MATANDMSDIEHWARTAEFGSRPNWGAVEDSILRFRLTPDSNAPVDGQGDTGVMAGAMVVPAFLAVLALIAPIAAFIVLMGGSLSSSSGLWESARGFVPTLLILSLFPLVTIAVSFLRHWALGFATIDGIAALFSALNLFLLAFDYSGGGAVLLGVLAVFGILAGVVGSLVMAKAAVRLRRRVPLWARGMRAGEPYLQARAVVIDILGSRGLVAVDSSWRRRAIMMPLGSWDDLEAPRTNLDPRGGAEDLSPMKRAERLFDPARGVILESGASAAEVSAKIPEVVTDHAFDVQEASSDGLTFTFERTKTLFRTGLSGAAVIISLNDGSRVEIAVNTAANQDQGTLDSRRNRKVAEELASALECALGA